MSEVIELYLAFGIKHTTWHLVGNQIFVTGMHTSVSLLLVEQMLSVLWAKLRPILWNGVRLSKFTFMMCRHSAAVQTIYGSLLMSTSFGMPVTELSLHVWPLAQESFRAVGSIYNNWFPDKAYTADWKKKKRWGCEDQQFVVNIITWCLIRVDALKKGMMQQWGFSIFLSCHCHASAHFTFHKL